MINKLIVDTLKPLQVPVIFQQYSGEESTYITFHEYFQDGEGYEDDNESFTGHYIQVDVWAKGDYTALVDRIRVLLVTADFTRLSEADFYEPDTSLYHKGLKFFYLESKEEI